MIILIATVVNTCCWILFNNLDTCTLQTYNNSGQAGVAELADAADLKSAGVILVGSSPTLGITPKRRQYVLVGIKRL